MSASTAPGGRDQPIATAPEDTKPPAAIVAPSSGQRRLWFVQQLEPESPVYNVPYLIRLHGELNLRALQRAIDAIVERHDVLRTIFVTVDGEPGQVVQALWAIDLQMTDLTPLPEKEREAELTWRGTELARKPFDLARDLMLRAHLFRLGPQEHALMLVLHHIAADGWSLAILYRELGVCYEAFAHGRTPELPPLPMHYSAFAAWQQEYLKGETLERLISHWRTYLDGAPPLLEIPADRPRPPLQSHLGDTAETILPASLVNRLWELGAARGATLFMTLLAGFDILLHQCTGRTDIVIGSPMAGRSIPEIEGLIGFFVNTLVVRTRLDGDPNVGEVLSRVRESTVTAFEGRDLPFEQLIAELQPPRQLSFDPICQIYFSLQNMPTAPLVLSGLSLTLAPVYTGTAKCDLNVWGAEQPDGSIELTAEYASDLFRGETIQKLLRRYRTVLEAMVANPYRAISQLPPVPTRDATAGNEGGKTADAARVDVAPSCLAAGSEAPNRGRTPAPGGHAGPQHPSSATGIEQTIAAIWKDVLRRDDVGVDDNFFDSGGHSLRLMQVQSRIRDVLGVDLPVLKLFQFPTIRLLARHLAETGAAPKSETDVQRKLAERLHAGTVRRDAARYADARPPS